MGQEAQEAGDIVIQLRKNEESHQKRDHALHQVLTKEWQGAVDKLKSPEERQHILQKMVEENPNVVKKNRKYIDDARERQQALGKQAGEMAVELSQKDMVQATREVHDEIGNDPELARQNTIGMMQKLSRQNEVLRKGTGRVNHYWYHSYKKKARHPTRWAEISIQNKKIMVSRTLAQNGLLG